MVEKHDDFCVWSAGMYVLSMYLIIFPLVCISLYHDSNECSFLERLEGCERCYQL